MLIVTQWGHRLRQSGERMVQELVDILSTAEISATALRTDINESIDELRQQVDGLATRLVA